MSTVVREDPYVAEISDYERERGKPMPSFNHSIVQTQLIVALSKSPDWRVCSELSLRLGERDGTPDLSVYPHRPADFTRDIIRETTPPTMVVEILSPSQGSGTILERVDHYLAHGVQSAWVVEPVFGDVLICTADGKRQKFSSGIVVDPVTGLSADLSQVFA